MKEWSSCAVLAKYRRETKIFENGVQVAHLNCVMTLDDVIASRGGPTAAARGRLRRRPL